MSFFLAVSLLLICSSAHGSNPSDSAVLASNSFGVDLLRSIKPGKNQNVFFSPYSISTAFALVSEGANGDTQKEINQTFHFDNVSGQNASSFRALQMGLNEVQKSDNIDLHTINGLWIERKFQIKPTFLQVAKESFFAKLESVDFLNNSGTERQKINRWVEDDTEGRIKDLMPVGSVTPLTRLVLVNAIYFKGKWANPFEKSMTKSEDFHLEGGEIIQVPMMHLHGSFRCTETPDFQCLELPYNGNSLSMFVLLPKTKIPLPDLVATLDVTLINKIREQRLPEALQVSLPRFKLECSLDLPECLRPLGVKKAFAKAAADFTGITNDPDLSISGAFHKAYVDVDEEGTIAAAATGMGFGTMAIMRNVEFRADHPFLFWIQDNGDGAILFMGRVEGL